MGAFDIRLDFDRLVQPRSKVEVRREVGGSELLLWITFRNGYPEIAGGTAAGRLTGPTIFGTPNYVSNPFGRAFRTSSTTYIYWDDPNHALDATQWSMLFVGNLGTNAGARCVVSYADPANLSTGFVVNQREFGTNNNIYNHNGTNLQPGVFGIRPADAFSYDFWNGPVVTRGSVSGVPNLPTNPRLCLGRVADLSSWVGADADINDVFLFKDRPGDAAWAGLMASPYTSLFGPESFDIWVPTSGGGADLSGNATAQATATGTISKDVSIVGASVSTATATGTVSKIVNIAGTGSGTASAAGTLAASGGSGPFASDTFTGTDGTELTVYDANWVQQFTGTLGISGNAIRVISGSTARYTHSATPPSADYSVSADVTAKEADMGNGACGVIGRFGGGSYYYMASYVGATSQRYELRRGATLLGSSSASFPINTTRNLRLEMIGSAIKVYADEVEVISVTDTDLTAAGLAGVYANSLALGADKGGALDNFSASAAASGANLAGAASGQTTASGGLTLSIPLSASAVSQALASAGMSVGKPLSGDAIAQALSTAALSVTGSASLSGAAIAEAVATASLAQGVPLSGSAAASAVAAAGLSQGIPLGGAAQAQAIASASMALAKQLSGAAASQSSSSGGLSLSVSLAGTGIAEAAAAGGLTTISSGLGGAALVTATASGALTHGVPVSGASLAVSNASGSLTQLVPLGGAAASASLATGGLNVTVNLSGAALADALATAALAVTGNTGLAGTATGQASASGTVTLRVNLDGAAVSQAIAAGALAGTGALVPSPGFAISPAARSWSITAPQRTWRVAS